MAETNIAETVVEYLSSQNVRHISVSSPIRLSRWPMP